MATPEKPKEEPEKKPRATAPKKRGNEKNNKAKAPKPKVKKHGRTPGEKTAREYAVDYLKSHGGKAKFGELTKYVADKLGGNLSWTPTYYLKSPGFSRPERGIVAFSERAYEKGQAEISQARRDRLAAARAKAGKKPKGGKKGGKKGKKESVLERREKSAKALKEKKAKQEEGAAEEFDELVEETQKNSKRNGGE